MNKIKTLHILPSNNSEQGLWHMQLIVRCKQHKQPWLSKTDSLNDTCTQMPHTYMSASISARNKKKVRSAIQNCQSCLAVVNSADANSGWRRRVQELMQVNYCGTFVVSSSSRPSLWSTIFITFHCNDPHPTQQCISKLSASTSEQGLQIASSRSAED